MYLKKLTCKQTEKKIKRSQTTNRKENDRKPAVVLAEDVLYSLCQGEGLAGTIGPNDKNGGQRDRDGCGDGQDGLFLFGIQTRIQLLIPLPEGGKRMEAFFDDQINCYYKTFQTQAFK